MTITTSLFWDWAVERNNSCDNGPPTRPAGGWHRKNSRGSMLSRSEQQFWIWSDDQPESHDEVVDSQFLKTWSGQSDNVSRMAKIATGVSHGKPPVSFNRAELKFSAPADLDFVRARSSPAVSVKINRAPSHFPTPQFLGSVVRLSIGLIKSRNKMRRKCLRSRWTTCRAHLPTRGAHKLSKILDFQ